MHKILFALILSAIALSGFAQDTLQLINGKKIIVSSLTLQENDISYRKANSGVVKKIKNFRVFSVLYKDGTEKVVFTSDSLDPMDFKVDEMRNFVKGEQDASHLYRTYVVPAIGVVVGAASGLAAFYGIIGPPLYATALGYSTPNVDKQLTFKVSGDAAQSLGITEGKHLNMVSSTSNVTIKKDQVLKVNGAKIKFQKDADVNEAVNLINNKFNCSRVQAMSNDGKLTLFKGSGTLLNDGPYREGYSKKVREKRIKSGLLWGFGAFILSGVVYAIIGNNDN
jgi:hypothetical protein